MIFDYIFFDILRGISFSNPVWKKKGKSESDPKPVKKKANSKYDPNPC